MKRKGRGKEIFVLAGSVLAYMAGSGFTTGQEVIQYYVPFGVNPVLVGITVAVILALVNIGFIYTSKKAGLERGSDIYEFLSGKYFGKFFDYFAVFFSFMLFMAMIAGGAATLEEQYGMQTIAGALIFMVLVAATVMMGLNKMVDVIGVVAPIFAVFVFVVAVVTIANDGSHIGENLNLILNNGVELIKVSPNWFFSGISLTGLIILMFSVFTTELATKHELKSLAIGQTTGIVSYVIVDIVLAFAFISNVGHVAGTQLPTLILAEDLVPGIGKVFGIVISLAIYTTCCPLLYAVAKRFSNEGTKKNKIIIWAVAAAACIIAVFVPFNVLINFVYKIVGYVGALIIIFMVIKLIRIHMDGKNAIEK